MTKLVRVALLALTLSGCAFGTVRPDGEIRGFALGHAKLETCTAPEWPGVPWAVPEERCCRIAGGALSVSGWEVFGTLAAGAALYFSGGAL